MESCEGGFVVQRIPITVFVKFFFNINRTVLYPGGGILYITEGDARRNFQKQPLKVTISGVAPVNFISQKLPLKFSFTEIAQEY